MAFQHDLLDRQFGRACGCRTETEGVEIRAYYGECRNCSWCKAFLGGQNDMFCGACGCHKDMHRY